MRMLPSHSAMIFKRYKWVAKRARALGPVRSDVSPVGDGQPDLLGQSDGPIGTARPPVPIPTSLAAYGTRTTGATAGLAVHDIIVTPTNRHFVELKPESRPLSLSQPGARRGVRVSSPLPAAS
jgi:hypothetical protein